MLGRVKQLLNSLVCQDENLRTLVDGLLAGIKPKQEVGGFRDLARHSPLTFCRQVIWQPNSMEEIEARQSQLERALLPEVEVGLNQNSARPKELPIDESKLLPPGWCQIPQSSWVPCPIGIPIQ